MSFLFTAFFSGIALLRNIQSPCNYPFKLQLYWLLTKTIWNGYFLINPTTDDTLVLIICVETKLHPSAVLIWFLKMRHTDLRLTWNTSQSTILSITSVKHQLSISYDRKRPVTLYFPSKSTPTSFLNFCLRITFKGKILGKKTYLSIKQPYWLHSRIFLQIP